MVINICNHDCTELWDQVLYKKLSDYPNISDWEMKNIIDFIAYEEANGRTVELQSDSPLILETVKEKLDHKQDYQDVRRPKKITECTACPYRKGCMTEFVCHTAPLENAKSILKSGKLLSAVNARGLTEEELRKEERNAAHDPKDFFHYVMFSWGNCQAGDRLVMERKNNRMPTEEDLSVNFTPGIRFYFKYDELEKHPNATHDGFLPIKVKDELVLKDWVYAIVIPDVYRKVFEELVPNELQECVYYVKNDCKDIWDWSEKVYQLIENLEG
ncbi:MAG: phosphate ABC transporter ATPase [bacterium]|nr:phosphate ABC transporter ATPase [bacterium]